MRLLSLDEIAQVSGARRRSRSERRRAIEKECRGNFHDGMNFGALVGGTAGAALGGPAGAAVGAAGGALIGQMGGAATRACQVLVKEDRQRENIERARNGDVSREREFRKR